MLLTAVPAISASAEEKAPLLAGDVNQSGDVNILDMICANKAILGCEELSAEQIKAVDFNHNGEVDSSDSMTLLKYILDIIPGLPSVEQEFTATVTASSSEDAESAVSDAIPGFNKTVQETSAAAADYVITAVPDAEDYKGDNPEYANYSREYVEALTQPYDLTFEQQTEADFTLTLTGQNAEGSGKEVKTIQSLTINGNPGFCTTLEVQQKDTFTDAAYHLVWKQDGYMMYMTNNCDFPLDEVIRIAESVTEVQPAD